MDANFGWVDYSMQEQRDVLKTLNELSEDSVDALGLSVISDHYADKFFPGISTVQTRARYFVLVPYIFLELKKDLKKDPKEELERLEKECAKNLYKNNENETGIIGSQFVEKRKNGWVKRSPSDIYWNGLKTYDILKKDCSVKELIALLKNGSTDIGYAGNKNDDFDDTGDLEKNQVWDREIEGLYGHYKKNKENCSVLPTPEERAFLKERICDKAQNSLIAAMLKGEITPADRFDELAITPAFQPDFKNAVAFSRFARLLTSYYTALISNGENKNAEKVITEYGGAYREFDSAVYADLPEKAQRALIFLNECKSDLSKNDTDALTEKIRNREKSLKSEKRAKSLHPDPNLYSHIGVRTFDFRYANAKQIINDILNGEKNV